MEFPVSNLGDVGVNTDRAAVTLPANVWTEIENGRCDDGSIGPGVTWALWDGSVPNADATWLLYAVRQEVPYWFVAGNDVIYLWDGSSYVQVNQTIPNAPLQRRWSGIFDGEIPYLNHYADAPQYADFTDTDYFTDPTLKDIVYDPDGTLGVDKTFRDLNYRVRVLRAHKGFVFAGGLNKDGSNQGALLAWDSATASNIPSSNWMAGPTSLAGEFDCVDSGDSGRIVDMLSLRDDLIIYKENSAWIARRTGSTAPAWGVKKLIGIPGLIAQDCVVEYKGVHYVWGAEDIYVHQGQTAKSIVDDRVRKSFISLIDPDEYQNCFCVLNVEKKEIWFCAVLQGHTYPNRALIYQLIDNTFSVTDLPECAFMSKGVRIEASLAWEDALMEWGDANFNWGVRNFSPLDKAVIGVQAEDQDLLQFDAGTKRWDGSADQSYSTRFERTSVPIGGMKSRNIIKELIFSAEGTGALNVYVGTQDRPEGSIDWVGPRVFDVATDRRVKIRSKKGQFNCWRIEGETGSDWRITDMQVVYEASGER